jgi:hypothetical protein
VIEIENEQAVSFAHCPIEPVPRGQYPLTVRAALRLKNNGAQTLVVNAKLKLTSIEGLHAALEHSPGAPWPITLQAGQRSDLMKFEFKFTPDFLRAGTTLEEARVIVAWPAGETERTEYCGFAVV